MSDNGRKGFGYDAPKSGKGLFNNKLHNIRLGQGNPYGLDPIHPDTIGARMYQLPKNPNAIDIGEPPKRYGWTDQSNLGGEGPTGYTGWADPWGDRNWRYYTNGMLIENPRNPDHYRYQYIHDAIEKSDNEFYEEQEKIYDQYDRGKLTDRQYDRKLDALDEKYDMRQRALEYMRHDENYDVPWYVDGINKIKGLL